MSTKKKRSGAPSRPQGGVRKERSTKAPVDLIRLEVRGPKGKRALEVLMQMPRVTVTVELPARPTDRVRTALVALLQAHCQEVRVRRFKRK